MFTLWVMLMLHNCIYCTLIHTYTAIFQINLFNACSVDFPLTSSRCHLSCGDWLEYKREIRVVKCCLVCLLYFTFRMPCSIFISNQWLLRLVVDVAASDCQRTVWQDTCSRCSIVCGCWLQWLQVCVILFPHLRRVCVVLQWPLLSWFNKTHSPWGSAGFLSPDRGTEGSSMRYALLTSECCHWFVHSSTMSYSSACNLVCYNYCTVISMSSFCRCTRAVRFCLVSFVYFCVFFLP